MGVGEARRGAFGTDAFGRRAESAARFFSTPQDIIGQTVVVAAWKTQRLERLLNSSTDLTRQDKELTEQIADLTRQIHAMLTKAGRGSRRPVLEEAVALAAQKPSVP